MLFFIYFLIGAVVWIAVVAFDYGSLDQIPGISEIVKTEVKKDSFTGSTNELIRSFLETLEILNPNSSKNIFSATLDQALNKSDTVTNYVGWTVILFFWPLVLILVQVRKIIKSDQAAKITCFILIFMLSLGLLMHLAFNWSYNSLNSSPSVIVPQTTSVPTISSANTGNVSSLNSSASSSQNQSTSTVESTQKSQVDQFEKAMNKAVGAALLSLTAESKEEWTKVALEWHQALVLMKEVPPSSSNYAMAQERVNTYRENREIAKQKAVSSPI